MLVRFPKISDEDIKKKVLEGLADLARFEDDKIISQQTEDNILDVASDGNKKVRTILGRILCQKKENMTYKDIFNSAIDEYE